MKQYAVETYKIYKILFVLIVLNSVINNSILVYIKIFTLS